MNPTIKVLDISSDCRKRMLAVRDTLDILNGKWKIAIISALSFKVKHFNELERVIPGITGKMLSKELKDLEINQLVKRTVLDTKPITVAYELTAHGTTLYQVISGLADWGMQHRQQIMAQV